MTKVSLLATCYFPVVGGTETHVRNLALGLRKREITSEVVSLCDTRKWEPSRQLKHRNVEGISVAVWSSHSSGRLIQELTGIHYFPFPLPRLRKKLNASDLLHFHDDGDLSFPLSAARIRRPRMFTCHNIHGGIGLDFYRRRVIARNLFKNSADLFQVFSSRDMRQLSSLGIAEDKIRIIPNGVDTHLFQPRLAERSHNTVRIIWFGRIETAKGLIVLLRALKLLKNEARNFELLIGGRVWDEQYYKELLCFKDAAGLQEVRFLGFVENLPNFIREADIFVLPSLWETLPIVILEAMASGLPVVASTVGAVPEVIINNETGYLVPPGDPQALADKLRLLIDDPKLRRTMGNNARRRAESCFSIDDICDSVVKAYHEIM